MSKLLTVGMLLAMPLFALASDSDKAVYIAKEGKSFKCPKDACVRVLVKGIAGTTSTAKVDGPAKLEHTCNIIEPGLMGPGNREHDFKLTGTGKVKITVEISPPNGTKETKIYEFEVE